MKNHKTLSIDLATFEQLDLLSKQLSMPKSKVIKMMVLKRTQSKTITRQEFSNLTKKIMSGLDIKKNITSNDLDVDGSYGYDNPNPLNPKE